jgi:biopolymer transport protein ExbD
VRFPRQTKIFRGQLDVAPFAGVFFLLVLFLLLQSSLVFTPGIPIRLPEARALPGVDSPKVVVAIDATGQLYYENQVIGPRALRTSLQTEVSRAKEEKLTLIVQADRRVTWERMTEISLLAEQAGIHTVLMATRPIPGSPVPDAE